MGALIDLNSHRQRRQAAHPEPPFCKGSPAITCTRCAEPHPIIRLAGGEQRCMTAFFDGENWFCRNRGCRRAWLELSSRS
jgi:hypothetical protein